MAFCRDGGYIRDHRSSWPEQDMKFEQHPCDPFLTSAVQAFDRIAGGMPPNCSKSILAALIENGLIERTVRVIDRDLLGPVLRYGYSVSSALRT